MKRKPFSRLLHEEFDELGRDVVKAWYAADIKVIVQDNPDPYGIDLLIFRGGELTSRAEVEVRRGTMRYHTLHVPERKGKFFDHDLPTFLFSVWPDDGMLYRLEADDVLGSPLREVANRYEDQGEWFYDVPVWRASSWNIDPVVSL